MNTPLLLIGNKNYSSWSLRGWLLLKAFHIEFDEQLIQLFQPTFKPSVQQYSAAGKVPLLVLNPEAPSAKQVVISESLAIGLFTNDYLTDVDIWSGKPKSVLLDDDVALQQQRAVCQSIVSEMHAGFMGVRSEMPMNIRATAKVTPSDACLADLARIEAIFAQGLGSDAYKSSQNNYLFGEFTLADAFFAPVIFRLQSYVDHSNVSLTATTRQYMDVMLNNPHMQQWREAALQETRILAEDEAGEIVSLAGVLGG